MEEHKIDRIRYLLDILKETREVRKTVHDHKVLERLEQKILNSIVEVGELDNGEDISKVDVIEKEEINWVNEGTLCNFNDNALTLKSIFKLENIEGYDELMKRLDDIERKLNGHSIIEK